MLVDLIESWLREAGASRYWAESAAEFLGLVGLACAAWLANLVSKQVILRFVRAVIERTAFGWDDIFLKNDVFTRLSHVAPALVLAFFGDDFFTRSQEWSRALQTLVDVYLVLIALLVIDAALDAVVELYDRNSTTRRLPLKGFTQGAKLVSFLLGGVLVISIVLGRSPLYLLSGLGALTAVLLLVFKDAILGLVAGVQLSANRMVQIGDWIEMPKYGADGDVVDVGLTTVKIQNWDKTISTIPTYALISDPVKNWRGMTESGGRRIKRAIHLDMESFRFVDDALLKKLSSFARLRPYLAEKLPELEAYNAAQPDDLSVAVNGRRLTNIGCYRAYVQAYLRSHPHVHQGLTLLVRHLAPSDEGLPLEIYAFTSDVRWANYEGIQADIFDHLLAVVPEFDLRVFQSPTGHDLRSLRGEPTELVAPLSPRQPKVT